MGWKSNYFTRASKQQKFTIDGAAEYFRAEDLQPLRVGETCPHCHNGELILNPVDVDERIKLRIGTYRIAICGTCNAYCIVFPLKAVSQHEQTEAKSKTTDAEYNALMARWWEQNKGGPEAAMEALRLKWSAEVYT